MNVFVLSFWTCWSEIRASTVWTTRKRQWAPRVLLLWQPSVVIMTTGHHLKPLERVALKREERAQMHTNYTERTKNKGNINKCRNPLWKIACMCLVPINRHIQGAFTIGPSAWSEPEFQCFPFHRCSAFYYIICVRSMVHYIFSRKVKKPKMDSALAPL